MGAPSLGKKKKSLTHPLPFPELAAWRNGQSILKLQTLICSSTDEEEEELNRKKLELEEEDKKKRALIDPKTLSWSVAFLSLCQRHSVTAFSLLQPLASTAAISSSAIISYGLL